MNAATPRLRIVILRGHFGDFGHYAMIFAPHLPEQGLSAAKYLCCLSYPIQLGGTTAALQKVPPEAQNRGFSARSRYFRTIPRSAAKAESRVRRLWSVRPHSRSTKAETSPRCR